MQNQEKPQGLVEDYLGIGRRTVHILIGIAACTLCVMTGIYIAINGFQHWKTNMRRASEAMVIDMAVLAAARAQVMEGGR